MQLRHFFIIIIMSGDVVIIILLQDFFFTTMFKSKVSSSEMSEPLLTDSLTEYSRLLASIAIFITKCTKSLHSTRKSRFAAPE